MCPRSPTDGHDAPRLIDETVPGEAAVVKDVGVGLEDAVRQPGVAHELQTFSTGFNSGHLGDYLDFLREQAAIATPTAGWSTCRCLILANARGC